MPLEKLSSKKAFVSNLKTEIHAGKSQDQALAIAYAIKRKARRYGGKVHVGPIIGDTGGRADKVNTNVPSGCYIVPSDVVSGLGEGNSLAGMRIIEHMFPHPHGPGATSSAEPVPVAVAHGEVSISPEQLMAKFGGDLDHAHLAMDKWVVHERKKIIKTMQKLPGPAQD